MRTPLATILLMLLASSAATLGWADGASQKEMRSLDEQVQEIKTDVLGIATDLNQLEEQLLFPSNTQVSVFMSLSQQESFRLDAVQLSIDGALATHHIYSFKELDALKSGGVQRLFTGNVASGEHVLEISVIGKLENGKDYKTSQQFTFSKGADPRLLGIALAGPGSGGTPIQLQDW
jgi:hypothetical protein